MSVAIANQLFLAYLGRPADAQWRSSTANLLNGNQPSVALQTSFYSAAVAEGVFSTTDSNSTMVNKIFLQIFGFGASSFEQTAWGNLITNGTISVATAAWTIFSSYLGATNVPAPYQQPAQSKLIALGAYTDQLANDSASNVVLSQGGGASTIARSFVTGVNSQATAATAVTNIVSTVASLATAQTGSTFTLTTGIDNVVGTSNNDLINAGETTGPAVTLTAGDSINGGAGTDTLNVVVTAPFTGVPTGVTVSNVENVNVTSGGAVTISTVSGFSGLTTLGINHVGNATVTAAATTAETITGTLAAATVSVNGGSNVTVTETGGTGAGTINVGTTTAAAGTVTVSSATSANDVTAAAINVTGGTTIAITQTQSNAVNHTNTNGVVTLVGNASTTGVTVTNAAVATASGTVAGVIANTVNITDVNYNSATKAGTITSATVSNYTSLIIGDNALTTLSVAGGSGNIIIDNSGLTTATNKTLSITVNGLTGGTLDDADIYTTLNVTGSGAVSTLANITFGGTTALNLAGDKALTVTAISGLSALTSVTSTSSAAVTLGSALGAGVTYTGGAGADSIILTNGFTKAITTGAGNDTVTYGGAAGTGGSVVAGDGTDTIVMTGAQAATASATGTFNSTFSGFEVLKLSALAADTINLAGINNVNSVSAGGSTGHDVINGYTSGGTLTLTADVGQGGDYTANITNAALSSTDVFNIVLSKSTGVLAAGVVNVASVETVNISTADAASGGSAAVIHTLTLTDATDKTIIVTGNNGLTLTSNTDVATTLFDASGVVANGTADTTANLAVTYTSAYTGSATVTIIGGAGDDVLTGDAANDIMNGGAGADRLSGGGGNDTISGDAGNDTILGGGGQDSLTGGAGVDFFDFLNTVSVSGTGANVDKITDFVAGTDKLAFQADAQAGSLLAGVTLTAGAVTVSALGTAIAGGATVNSVADVYTALGIVLDAAALAATDTVGAAVVARVVTFANGSNAGSFLVVNDHTAGFQGANDIVINITGITGTLAASDFSFFA
jgi:S-layer protein